MGVNRPKAVNAGEKEIVVAHPGSSELSFIDRGRKVQIHPPGNEVNGTRQP
ncbi:MAG: hypothetical protein J6T01_03870 [Kiritimatiellae bacterium]|nr:hypothetical protein [Kiritimatiellia bacterium]